MQTELARLRAKTDQELCTLIARQLHRSRRLAGRGAYRDAAKDFLAARALLAGAGIDVDRATRDLATNAKAIDAILVRNNDQATAFGFKGTPSFIVGKFRVPGVLTMAQFDQAIADARKAAAKKK